MLRTIEWERNLENDSSTAGELSKYLNETYSLNFAFLQMPADVVVENLQ